MMEKEIWKEVLGGKYQVSNFGNIRSHIEPERNKNGTFNKFVKSQKHKNINGTNTDGYRILDLKSEDKRRVVGIHRLIAKAFIPNPKNKPEVNHKNGIRNDNRVENLEWVTHKENMSHARNTGLMPIGEKSYHAKLTRLDVLEMRSAYNLGCFSYKDFARAYGTSVDNIRHIIKGRSWRHLL